MIIGIDDFKNEEEYIAQMEQGGLLNPRIDSTFKALFTQPTQESHDALHSFLEAATERKIKSFELRSNEPPVGFHGQRSVSYDIACEFDDGLSADVEMQAFDQQYDYGKRAEYQVARLETTYLKKGDDWEKSPTVYQITVLDFTYDSACKKVVSRYAMRTKDGRELSNSLNIIFVDLTKAVGIEDNLENNTPLENWAVFLKNADNPEKKEIINKLAIKEAGLMNAQKSLSSISTDRDLWFAQYRQELHERDERSRLSAGIKKSKLETARNAIAMNLTPAQISQLTGLTLEEIAEL